MKNRNDNLKRVIVDFKKLTPEILALLVEKYPDGYDEDQIVSFRNAKNEIIEAVEVTTSDTKYLVKVSTKLAVTMEMIMKILMILIQKLFKIQILNSRMKTLKMILINSF